MTSDQAMALLKLIADLYQIIQQPPAPEPSADPPVVPVEHSVT